MTLTSAQARFVLDDLLAEHSLSVRRRAHALFVNDLSGGSRMIHNSNDPVRQLDDIRRRLGLPGFYTTLNQVRPMDVVLDPRPCPVVRRWLVVQRFVAWSPSREVLLLASDDGALSLETWNVHQATPVVVEEPGDFNET
jgi:hypothetical protein